MAATLAYMAARGDDRIAACTFFTAQVDFTEPGELGVFIDEDQLAGVEEVMSKKGYLDGTEMATTFNMLRANDLIWSFVVNNYLMGKDPFPFDLLFWNADATRMPAAMHSYYLRNMYQKNLLVQPGGLTHRQRADRPAQDHDPGLPAGRQGRPHRARQVGLQGDADLLRAGALHAGGLGPYRRRRQSAARQEVPALAERDGEEPADARRMAGRRARNIPGSWWNDWDKWLSAKSGAKVPARVPGAGGLPAIEDAPGSYVKVRTID